MLTAMFNDFRAWARVLKEEEGIDYTTKGREVIQLMADGYYVSQITGDTHGQNKYIAGLMLRFWYKIKELKEKASSISGLDYADFAQLLFAEIHRACMDQAWNQPGATVNAQQVINQCIASRIVPALYYDSNLQKNKANMNTFSLETELDDDGKTTLLDTLLDENDVDQRKYNEDAESAIYLIQNCINKKKLVEAIILDTIAFNDVQKITKKVVKSTDEEGRAVKYTQHISEFWPYKCVQLLSNLPEDYVCYFSKQYDVIENELIAAVDAIKKANNQKLYRYLDRTLEDTKVMFNA